MKTSPELLSSILQVLTKIEKKMGGESAEPKPAFSDLITGKRSLKDVFKKKPSVEEKDSLISVLLGNTSLKQWAMLRSNVGVIKKMSENLDILSSSADKLSSSLAEIKFGEFDTLIHLLDKSVDDKSIFGSETSKNILTVSEKIKILYWNHCFIILVFFLFYP